MPLYDFPLWATDVAKFPTKGIRGAGWKIIPIETPYTRYGTKAWERHFYEMRRKYPHYADTSSLDGNGKLSIAPQIIVEAKSRQAAQRAFELLAAAIVIIDGSNLFEFENALVIPRNRDQLEDLTQDDVDAANTSTYSRGNVILATMFAAALSRSKSLSYSAFKLKQSYHNASTHWMNLHPRYSPKDFGVSKLLSDHVKMASAVTLAYSAIEELQLEPRSIAKRPVKDRGVWDPSALANLQLRLKTAGVDLAQPETWTVRGSQTRIHKSPRDPAGIKLSWTKGKVRDKSVKIEDALLAASWLRSKCSTHRYTKETQSITLYDVTNVQILARRLLLERTGIWERLLDLAQGASSASQRPAVSAELPAR